MTNYSTEINIPDKNSMLDRYRRAEALEHARSEESMVLNAQIFPRWIGESDCFWYSRLSRKSYDSVVKIATEYRLVNAKKATNIEAFDHVGLAKALAAAVNQTVDVLSLPIDNLEFDLPHKTITFDAFDQRWEFDGAIKQVEKIFIHPDHWLISPDGTKAAFIKEYNLWIRDLDSGEERALTHDGQRHYAYATQPEARNLIDGISQPESTFNYEAPEALWSPDSTQLFTLQMDERQVRSLPSMLYVPQDGTIAPRVSERKYALPGDKHVARYRMLVIDVVTGIETAANYLPIEDSFIWLCPFSGNRAWWSGDGHHAYFVDMSRGQKTLKLVRFESETGISNILFEESSPTYIDLGLEFEYPAMLMPLPETNEVLWFSERSGWRHLYLYDLTTGELKKTVTTGKWLVRGIGHFDKDRRELWIQVAGRVEGRNPYYRELARVHIDTGEMTVVVSSDHDYSPGGRANTGISCTGNFVAITRFRVDEASITELRDRNGEVLLTVERADVAGLPAGWQWPEPVTMKADDGITDIYGVVFRPSDFDPDKQYPVLDIGMVTPFYSLLPTGAFLPVGLEEDTIGNVFYMPFAALAELGFIVTAINGRGTPHRSKAFHDFGCGAFMDGGGMVDHVAGIKQLAERYPSMNLDNVGLMSTDAPGNGAIFGLLKYPDFYKVGVAYSPWDPRLVKQGEVYCGIDDEAAQLQFQPVWKDAVHNLQGKLLLITGMLDQFFHCSMTFQCVDAFVKANKDVDLLIQPNGCHGPRVINAHRRAWDYVVQHMLGLEPPKNFKLVTGEEKIFPRLFSEKIDDRINENG